MPYSIYHRLIIHRSHSHVRTARRLLWCETLVFSTTLLRNTDDATRRPSPSIPRTLTLLMPPLAQIIGTGMHHNRASKHTLRPNQLDMLIRNRILSITLPIRREVAQVTDVTLVVLGCAVGFAEGVEVGAGAGAAVGVVAELVDVHAALGGGVVAGDVVGYGCGGGFGGLVEGDGSADFGVSAEDCDWGEEGG